MSNSIRPVMNPKVDRLIDEAVKRLLNGFDLAETKAWFVTSFQAVSLNANPIKYWLIAEREAIARPMLTVSQIDHNGDVERTKAAFVQHDAMLIAIEFAKQSGEATWQTGSMLHSVTVTPRNLVYPSLDASDVCYQQHMAESGWQVIERSVIPASN